jgi:hypothetical protein
MKVQFDPFIVEYDKIEWPIYDFKTECKLAIEVIVSKNTDNLPIALMMSGGIDSQIAGESLLLANIPFICVIGKLYTSLPTGHVVFNNHDYVYAERWCAKHNIEVRYCMIDVFKQADVLCEYALSSKGFSPQYACHMFIMKWCKDNGFFYIAGGTEIDIVLKNDEYYATDDQREYPLEHFCKLHDIRGEFMFYRQNSRLTAATLELPTVKRLMDEKVVDLIDHKHEYFSDIFEFETRPKRTGFERIQEWDSILRTPMKKIMGQYDDKYYTPILQFQNK